MSREGDIIACPAVRSDRNACSIVIQEFLVTFIEEQKYSEISILRHPIEILLKSHGVDVKNHAQKNRERRGTKSHGCAWSQTFLNWISCENPVSWFLWVCTFGQIGSPDLLIFFCMVFIMKFTSFERIFDPTLHPRHLGVLLLLDNLEIRLVLNSFFSFVVWVSETVRTRQWAVGKCFRNCFELEEARRNVLWSPNT